MHGIQIFTHSLRQVFGNLGAALRISAVLTLVQFGLFFALGLQVVYSADGGRAMMMNGTFPFGRLALLGLISGIISLWIAVAWHRYVLLEETPGAVIPTWNGSRIWSYFVTGLLIFLIGLAATIVTALLAGALAGFGVAAMGMARPGGHGIAGGVAGSVVGVATMLYIFFRYSPALPASALGKPLGLSAAWRTMAGKGGTLIMLTIVSTLFSVAIIFVPAQVFGPGSIIGLVIGLIAQWINLMVGISVITTLYGHYVERRALV